ncbi:hypothetical protein CBM2589_U10227 [Cupriavidus taiwanensis]|uniref:Uncharacterized protein n=1 Tax=Cupriavidus taiwanensis TaxID=164546 RepID=A0A375CQL9_9BURK|nr:hypothetical protein CBM2589_U10227 [Cupriavidus taiwanensis]
MGSRQPAGQDAREPALTRRGDKALAGQAGNQPLIAQINSRPVGGSVSKAAAALPLAGERHQLSLGMTPL